MLGKGRRRRRSYNQMRDAQVTAEFRDIDMLVRLVLILLHSRRPLLEDLEISCIYYYTQKTNIMAALLYVRKRYADRSQHHFSVWGNYLAEHQGGAKVCGCFRLNFGIWKLLTNSDDSTSLSMAVIRSKSVLISTGL